MVGCFITSQQAGVPWGLGGRDESAGGRLGAKRFLVADVRSARDSPYVAPMRIRVFAPIFIIIILVTGLEVWRAARMARHPDIPNQVTKFPSKTTGVGGERGEVPISRRPPHRHALPLPGFPVSSHIFAESWHMPINQAPYRRSVDIYMKSLVIEILARH